MKLIQALFFTILPTLFFAACGSNTRLHATQLTESIKGYELYSWQDGGQWKFSLLVGTNREKTLEEIQSPATALIGVDALQSVLEKVPVGQYVIWSSKEALSFPPDDMIQLVRQISHENGLILNIVK